MVSILDGLNPQQRRAVEAPDGPTLILAGPGSGKTRVLTSRVAYLIGVRNIYPYRIMAVTFTNKAAREMRDRLTRMAGADKTGDLTLGTFHSICARLLRREAHHAGLDRDFTIYDGDDQINVVKTALAELNLDEKKYKPSSIHAAISSAKNELITPERYKPDSYFNEIAGRVYVRYNAILRANNALDFDDLLMETVLLLQRSATVREKVQERYLHVLVDEFQDTNIAQYELIKLIAGKHRSLFCVGDVDQGIYAWRGADHRNVLRLRADYPDLNIIALEQNYRSTQTILDAAMAVIKKNPNRMHINLFTQRGYGPKIAVREMFNEEDEAQYVVDTIAELVRLKAAEPGEIAVMYRTNAQSRAIEDAFVRAGMPYRLVGATRFYARKEIKDVLAYLRIVNNPADVVSLQRVINVPPRGIGEKTFAQLEAAARANDLTCLEVITQGELQGRGGRALKEFGALWAQWVRLRNELSVGQLFDHIIQTSGYKDYLKDGTEEGEERWANVMELRNVAAEAGDAPLSEFLSDIALVSDVDNYDEHANAPTLLTLHAAKGLEFKVVFIVGLVEGVLPHSRSMDDPERMAEERRLMYVGITRAKERLYLLRPFRRSQWGDSEVAEPSRFLADLPDEVVDGKPRKNSELMRDAASWSGGKLATPRPASADMQFKPGDRVIHPRFGRGLVLRSTRVRDDEEVEVFFEDAGGKRLSAALSGLKKLAG
ncbi:MAG: DNA helicase [Candidatus Roseilinea sp.]|nr:MAG: DNA helicase [Candidatus Roseilinea sp.]